LSEPRPSTSERSHALARRARVDSVSFVLCTTNPPSRSPINPEGASKQAEKREGGEKIPRHRGPERPGRSISLPPAEFGDGLVRSISATARRTADASTSGVEGGANRELPAWWRVTWSSGRNAGTVFRPRPMKPACPHRPPPTISLHRGGTDRRRRQACADGLCHRPERARHLLR